MGFVVTKSKSTIFSRYIYFGYLCPNCGDPIISKLKVSFALDPMKALIDNGKVTDEALDYAETVLRKYIAGESNNWSLNTFYKEGVYGNYEVEGTTAQCPSCLFQIDITKQSSNLSLIKLFPSYIESRKWAIGIVETRINTVKTSLQEKDFSTRLIHEKENILLNISKVEEELKEIESNRQLREKDNVSSVLSLFSRINKKTKKSRNELSTIDEQSERNADVRKTQLEDELQTYRNRLESISVYLDSKLDHLIASSENGCTSFSIDKGQKLYQSQIIPLPQVAANIGNSEIKNEKSETLDGSITREPRLIHTTKSSVNYCIRCGAKLMEGSHFCSQCGAKL